MRRLIEFPCAGETLMATLDEGSGGAGLLIVSGGNELRMGAHRGMAMLAADLSAHGIPVFRFDRRGIGDSTGVNGGFESSAGDIAAAVAAFRAQQPQLTRIIAFGNCDAATALALFHRAAGIDELVLANPWVVDDAGDMPPPAAIRARYAERLRDPREWVRLVTGGVNIVKLVKGLRSASRKPDQAPDGLAARVGGTLDATIVPLTILLARGDNTAIAFRDAWNGPAFDALRVAVPVHVCDTDSHSFAGASDKAWLRDALISVITR